MKYWAIINNVKVGPNEPSELLALGLKSDTLVWREGMEQWAQAGKLTELSWLFNQPPTPPQQPQQQLPPCPPTYLAWALVTTLLCCLPAGIVAIVYSSSVETKYAHGDYQGAVSASGSARLWCILALVLGIIGYPIAFFGGFPNWFYNL
jgi:hypothetical protein